MWLKYKDIRLNPDTNEVRMYGRQIFPDAHGKYPVSKGSETMNLEELKQCGEVINQWKPEPLEK